MEAFWLQVLAALVVASIVAIVTAITKLTAVTARHGVYIETHGRHIENIYTKIDKVAEASSTCT